MTTRSDYLHHTAADAITPKRSAGDVLTRLFNRLAEWQERHEQRAHLAAMGERMLKDIGVSSVDAAHESTKPFWRA